MLRFYLQNQNFDRNFNLKWNFWLFKIEILVQNYKTFSKFQFLSKISIFVQNFYFFWKFRFLVKRLMFCSKFRFLVKSLIFCSKFRTHLNHEPHCAEIIDCFAIPVSDWLLKKSKFELFSFSNFGTFLEKNRFDLINSTTE